MNSESTDTKQRELPADNHPETPGNGHDERQHSAASDLRTAVCGFLMGAADIVPGVSGGTVAFVTGIYERLLGAVSAIGLPLLKLLLSGRFREAARQSDLRFLAALGIGIVIGAGSLASVMKHLLLNHRSVTFAAFTGLILGSAILVGRRIRKWTPGLTALLFAGAAGAYLIVTLQSLQQPPDSLLYLFFCGSVGICAMILPGISGAFILLLLGRYDTVLDAIRSITHGDLSAEVILTVTVFAAGCLTGLLSFCRVLKFFLRRFEYGTMAVLAGFMVGSLYKLWPFQTDLTPETTDLKRKQFEHTFPEAWTPDCTRCLAAFVLGLGLLLAFEWYGSRRRMISSEQAPPA